MKLKMLAPIMLTGLGYPQAALAQEGDWSGPYVGVFTGANATSTDMEDYWCWAACDAPTITTVKPLFGAAIGYDVAIDQHLVLGLEADISSGASKSFTAPNPPSQQTVEYFLWNSKVDWTATVRGRAGLAMDRTMFYVTGGFAAAKGDFSEVSTGDRTFGNHSANFGARWKGTIPGYSYGVGIEHQIGKIGAKVEVLRNQFARRDKCYGDNDGARAGLCWDDLYSAESKLAVIPSQTLIKVGINHRF